LSYEVQLFSLAIIFYLYDSSTLLHSNEAILTCDRAQRWHAQTGWAGMVFAGRVLCMLNPLTPQRPAFRLNWDFRTMEQSASDGLWSERARQLNDLAPMTFAIGAALFVLLPLGLFTPLGPYAVVPALVVLYGSITLALIQVYRRRLLATFDRRHFVGFAFECLACPPFAFNMVRRISLAYRISEPLPSAAVRLLDTENWARFKAYCVSRLDDALQLVGEDSSEKELLVAQRERLMGSYPP
jgi:hypothetical protein